MKLNILFLLIAAWLFMPVILSAESFKEVIVLYHNRPPYTFLSSDGSIQGILAEPIRSSFDAAGIKFQWQQVPPKRQLLYIKSNKDRYCGTGWFKNPEREKFARFSRYIYQDKPMIAVVLAENDMINSNMTIESVFKDQRLHLLRKDGYSYGAFIDEKLKVLKPRQYQTSVNNLQMIQMLLNRRGDYFFMSHEEAVSLISTTGSSGERFKEVTFMDSPPGNKRYLLCSKKVEPRLIIKINKELDKLLGE